MKISTYLANKRCPWCGEVVESPPKQFTNYRSCEHCGETYSNWYGGKITRIIFILLIVSYGVIVYLLRYKNFLGFFCVIPFIAYVFLFKLLDYGLFSKKSMAIDANIYKKDNTYIQLEQINAEIEIQNVRSWLDKRLIFRNYMILPVCFLDENSTPITDLICLELRNVKIKGTVCKCSMLFLIRGKHDEKYKHAKKVRLFYDKTLVGAGSFECDKERLFNKTK